MTVSPIDIERVVREVLAELGAAPDAKQDDSARSGARQAAEPAGDHAAPTGASEAPAPAAGTDGELVILRPVVTLADVEGRLEMTRRVVVPPKAVVTPAVRDELKRKRIALVVGTLPSRVPAASVRLVVVAVGKRCDPAAVAGTLKDEAVAVEPHRVDCLIAATDMLAHEVRRPDTLGLLLTRHTAAALCLANRHPGTRAILGSDAPAVLAAAESVGANLLVADPTAGPLFPLRQIVTGFCRGGIRPCPDVFREQLA